MPHCRPQPAGASRAAARAPVAGQRRHPADEVRAVIDALDQLLHDLQLGRLSQPDYDRCADVAVENADRLRSAFRGPVAPTNPPAWMSLDGNQGLW